MMVGALVITGGFVVIGAFVTGRFRDGRRLHDSERFLMVGDIVVTGDLKWVVTDTDLK